MKSISGKTTSAKEISPSKASQILSNFVKADTGASPAVSSYLRRASASYDDLVRLHKDIRAPKPGRKRRKLERVENEVSEGKKRHEKKRKSDESSSIEEMKKRRIEGKY